MNTESKNDTSNSERDFHLKKMSLYIDNAKSYIQISVGALILPAALIHQVKGSDGTVPIMWSLEISWLLFFFAIGFGLWYQYYAVRHVDYMAGNPDANYLMKNPGYIYGAMIYT